VREGRSTHGFFLCKFGAEHGWTSIKVDAQTDWRLAEELVVASYHRVAARQATSQAKRGRAARARSSR
jgi:hypothetical protein